MYRIASLFVLLAAGFGIADAWAAAPSPLASGASVSVSSSRAGVRPVSMTLQLHYVMQCSYPGAGALDIALPPAEQLPAHFPAGAALLDGKRVAVARVSGKTLRIAVPPPPRIMCDVIGPGTLTVQLTKLADLGNPPKPATYTVVARKSSHTFETTLRITS